MCKSLLYNKLIFLFCLLLSQSLLSQEVSPLHPDRSLDFQSSVGEGLHHFALTQYNAYDVLGEHHEILKDEVLSLLHTRYPEMTYTIENAPYQVLSEQEISKLLVQLINEETSIGIDNTNNSIWEYAQAGNLDQESIATLEFLYGYELFKQKRLPEAQKNFERLRKSHKGPYEYALYYSGLTSLLQGSYKEAIESLQSIGKNEILLKHTPYYLAAAHYGNGDYTTLTKFYSARIKESTLFNIEGLTKLVGYAEYKLKHFQESVIALNLLSQYRTLTQEENYVLAKSLLNTGQHEASSQLMAAIAEVPEGNQLQKTAQYEYALHLNSQGDYRGALSAFEEMFKKGTGNPEDIRYNISVLEGKLGNYDKVAHHALDLLPGKYRTEATQMLTEVLDHLSNEDVYLKVVDEILTRSNEKSIIKQSLYKKGLVALQSNNQPKALKYFDKLKEVDPKIEERGAVAAWKGIMAYNNGDFNSAIPLLKSYLSSKAINNETTAASDEILEFNAHYFLGYSNFKLKNHNAALGHFAKSLELKPQHSDRDLTEDIQLRLADSYFLMDRNTEALAAYNRVDELNGMNRPYALWQKAVIAELENKPYDQLLILDDIIGTHPNSKFFGRALFSSANTLFSLGKYDKSAKLYNRIQQEEVPTRMKEESIVQLGLISVNAGDYAKAESHYNSILENTQDLEIKNRAQLALKEIYAEYTFDTDAYLDLVEKSNNQEIPIQVDQVIFDLAQNNFENEKYEEAINQWNKLINELPESVLLPQSHYQIAISYERQKKGSEALKAYKSTAGTGNNEWSVKAYDEMERIAFVMNQDHLLYLQLLEDRKATFPDYKITRIQQLRSLQSAIATNNSDLAYSNFVSGMTNNTIEAKNNYKLLTDLSILLMKEKQWSKISELNKYDQIKNIIDADPKHIYFRGLAYMNQLQMDEALVSITDHYSTLLNDPAWLAKSIILMSDIYVLQKDKDSAIAALQALIETKSEVPPSLIEMAKNRLSHITPEN